MFILLHCHGFLLYEVMIIVTKSKKKHVYYHCGTQGYKDHLQQENVLIILKISTFIHPVFED